jgi:hypothetical protein
MSVLSMGQDLAQEKLGPRVLWIVEEFVGIILLDNLSLVHENDSIGNRFCEPHFVGNA